MKRKVAVLMATYNSEKYMRCQIDSILAQEGVDVTLLVRDDGSDDSTTDILNEYSKNGKLNWYKGDNLKSARCFMQLLKDAPDADYYAFADHDDKWMTDKLIVAIEKLEDTVDSPALYLSQPQSADEELKALPTNQFKPNGGFAESMIYWFAMGCTMVLNNKLKETINSYTPEFLYMHDVWIYSIANAIGAKVVWDPTPHTLNRQHGGNVVGLNASPLTLLRLRIKRFFDGGEVRYKQACELKKGYESVITPENKKLLLRFVDAKESLITRIGLIFDSNYRCSNKQTIYLFWANLLLNKF